MLRCTLDFRSGRVGSRRGSGFDRLRDAGLITVQREGRSMIYAARFDTMNALLGYLTENCCQEAPGQRMPAECKTPALSMTRKREKVS